eukprot:scaffold38388_cov18-Prasinocladus_malaysianus.AAC.1
MKGLSHTLHLLACAATKSGCTWLLWRLSLELSGQGPGSSGHQPTVDREFMGFRECDLDTPAIEQ